MPRNLLQELTLHLTEQDPQPLPWECEVRRYSSCERCLGLFRNTDLAAYGTAKIGRPRAVLCRECVPGWAADWRQRVPGLEALYQEIACQPPSKRSMMEQTSRRAP